MSNYERCLLCSKRMGSRIDICKMADWNLKYIDKLQYFITDLDLPEEYFPINICKPCGRDLVRCYSLKKLFVSSIEKWKENKKVKKTDDNTDSETSKTSNVSIKTEPEESPQEASEDVNLQTTILKNIKQLLKTEQKEDYTEINQVEVKQEEESDDTLSLLNQLNFSRIKSKLDTALKTATPASSDAAGTLTEKNNLMIRKLFSCKICKEKFTSKFKLQAHILRHRISKHFMCNICGRCMSSKLKWRIHMTIHKKILTCTLCRKRFIAFDKDTRRRTSSKFTILCKACRPKCARKY